MIRTLTTLTDTTGGELAQGQMVQLDGRAREVLSVTESDSPGYRYVHFDGFQSPLHIGKHWEYSLVTQAPA